MKKAKEVSGGHSPGRLSPGCSVAWVSLRAALNLCCLAGPVAGPGPILTSSSQDMALPPCKIRALFCKVQRVRSKLHILNKSKTYESKLILICKHLCSKTCLLINILLSQIIFLAKAMYQYSVQEEKCRYLSFTLKVT